MGGAFVQAHALTHVRQPQRSFTFRQQIENRDGAVEDLELIEIPRAASLRVRDPVRMALRWHGDSGR